LKADHIEKIEEPYKYGYYQASFPGRVACTKGDYLEEGAKIRAAFWAFPLSIIGIGLALFLRWTTPVSKSDFEVLRDRIERMESSQGYPTTTTTGLDRFGLPIAPRVHRGVEVLCVGAPCDSVP
jgi:hypothetical protein